MFIFFEKQNIYLIKDALQIFTGIRADIEDFRTEGKDIMFNMVMNTKPLAEFVEIPEQLNGLQYNNIICGVIKGAIYQILLIGKVFVYKDILLGDEKTIIRVEVRREKLKEDD
ncbi:transport protein particle component, putative [Ichthyophthirius multifiliis]|uniref:Transport protein particle component, putative n=1 Tax=Ichthyophthirius multifiliis TaxID=5932 RepID=G0R1L6_ICHMU|nr:transport protein particle component, putative [Ichthyophthirius multifiliis]EGR28645.1 transport protein particle component, putative [Ichthyophthirius multifiliis]|eukprot:XP_004029881.1 transport protein particle component, putative [Ichthyophthirius multifiliis]